MNKGALAGTTALDDLIPAGVIWEYGGDEAPPGWLIADGSAVSRAQYPRLFKAIGVRHGAGNGTTTFNLPAHTGRVGVGKDGSAEFTNVGQTGGFKTHTLTQSEAPAHNHVINISEATRDLNHWHNHSHTHGLENHDHTINHWHSANFPRVVYSTGNVTHAHAGGANTGAEGVSGGNYYGAVWTIDVDGNANGAPNGQNRSSWFTNAQGRGGAEGDTTGWPITDRWDPNHNHGVSGSSNNNTPAGGAHNNLQPYVVVTYIIKY